MLAADWQTLIGILSLKASIVECCRMSMGDITKYEYIEPRFARYYKDTEASDPYPD